MIRSLPMIGNMAQQSHSSCVGKYLFSDPCEWLTMGKSPWRLHALQNDLELLVIRPASTSTGINDSQPFNLSTVLIAVHKDCYTALILIRQGGPHRRETRNTRTTTIKLSRAPAVYRIAQRC